MRTNKIRLKNGALILVMILCSAAALLYGASSMFGKKSAGRVLVLVNGEPYAEQDIRAGETIIVSQPDGCENVVRMTENGFYMQSANCKNQDCVHQGEVNGDNYLLRTLGTSVICIPNRVEIRLVLADDAAEPEIEIPDA